MGLKGSRINPSIVYEFLPADSTRTLSESIGIRLSDHREIA